MKKPSTILPRWSPRNFFAGPLRRFLSGIPAFVLMAVIFVLSSQPSEDLPNFDLFDKFVKKGGHAIGYGLLALSYLYALGLDKRRYWLAWLLTILFAISDEIHQSFVPTRHPSIWDVILFDNFGAVAALLFYQCKHGKDEKNHPL